MENIGDWTQFVQNVYANETADIFVATYYHANIYHARNGIIGGNLLNGVGQVPFAGTIAENPDIIVLIDNDVIWTDKQLFMLINTMLQERLPIVCGAYCRIDGNYEAMYKVDSAHLIKTGKQRYITPSDLEACNGTIVEVEHSGLGFAAISPVVFRSMEYPWFKPYQDVIKFKGNTYSDNYSEDTSFIMRAKNAGFKTYLHTGIRLGHKKGVII